MTEPRLYLAISEALALHERLLEAHGGAPGVRDMGALSSALHRPRSGYYESLFDEAAALLQSLARNHPFVDGNKRVAWAATKVFLLVNGHHLKASADEAETFVVHTVIEQHAELPRLAAWLREHASR